MSNRLPTHSNTTLPASAKVMVALLLTLLCGSIIYYKERMLFIDAPHVFFRVVNDGRLHIEEHRIGSFITQLVPLIGSWLHIPFKPLLVLYSVSFYGFYLGILLLLIYRFRSYSLAILFGLYLILFTSDTYYWPNNEVHQGIAWLILAFAISFYAAQKRWNQVALLSLFIIACALALWTHPLVMLVALFLWFFIWIDGRNWPFSRAWSIALSAVLILLSFAKYMQGANSGYDSGKIETVTHTRAERILHIGSSPVLHYFLRGCITNYWLAIMLFVAGIIALVKAKKWKLLLWTVGCAAGYLTLVCITFWDVQSGRFYIESEYMPLAIICSAPFVFFIVPRMSRQVAITCILLICIVRVGYICHASAAFTNRVAIIDAMNNKMRDKQLTKIIIPEPVSTIDDALIMNWGAPVESIFISKLKKEQPQRTFIFVPQEMLKFTNVGKDTLLSTWEKRTPKNLNPHYFSFDTTTTYRIMTYTDLMQ